jgi:hypothetical protein
MTKRFISRTRRGLEKKVDLEGVAIEIVASGDLNEAISLFRQAYNGNRRGCSARIQFVLHHALFRNCGPRYGSSMRQPFPQFQNPSVGCLHFTLGVEATFRK